MSWNNFIDFGKWWRKLYGSDRPSTQETQRLMRSNRCIGWKGYRV